MILAGDIGGTNSRLALFDERLSKIHEQNFRNEGRPGLIEIVREFLVGAGAGADGEGQVERAAFGVAGPVKEGRARMTNLPWRLDENELGLELRIPKFSLINDLVAHGEGIELLTPDQLIVVQEGDGGAGGDGGGGGAGGAGGAGGVAGNRAVIAAGTGLGEAGLFWDATARRHRAFASEGGHCDFSPRDERQIALLRWLREKYPNASWERVLSGPGLRNIYDFLITPQQMGKGAGLPSENPKPREIAEAAMRGARRHSAAAAPAAAPVTVAAPAAVEAQNMFTAFYGAEAANLALKVMATGGVYISGGIALGMVEQLKSSIFLDAFRATGPESIRQVLRKIPIHIVNFELNGLYGAANYARHL